MMRERLQTKLPAIKKVGKLPIGEKPKLRHCVLYCHDLHSKALQKPIPIAKPMKFVRRKSDHRGFALIVTLSLMILITVIAVGMLSLASISLRASSRGSAMAEARANARVAMALALGKLQITAGPDTRITAKADIVKPDNPPLLGVWESWQGKDHSADGRPTTPDYSNSKNARFLAWLTSASQNATMDQLPDSSGGVILLGSGTVGLESPSQRQVRLPPTMLKSGGSFAWWIGGENQKARLSQSYEPEDASPAGWSDLANSHAIPDLEPFGLDDSLDNPSAMAKAVSLKQVDLLGADRQVSQKFYHDLSTSSVGLLTNTATGGWRKDLSLFADTWTNLSNSQKLPFFRLDSKKDLLGTKPTTGNPLAAGSLLYPWSNYRMGATSNRAIYSFPPIGSWANLVSYATLYKDFSATSSVMSTVAKAEKIDGDPFKFIHEVRILPVIARMQWIFSHKTIPSTTAAGKYDLQVLIQPVFTLWNPYNVRISSTPAVTLSLQGSLPPVIEYKVGGALLPGAKKFTMQDSAIAPETTSRNVSAMSSGAAQYTMSAIPAFAPGETRIFSPAGNSNQLVAGYTPGRGMIYTIAKDVGSSGGGQKITTSMSFDSEYRDIATGVGMYLDMSCPNLGGTVLAYRMLYDRAAATTSYPPRPATQFPSPSLAEAAVATPFLSVTFGARMASNTYLPSKGFVQSSPFVNYTAMGKKGPAEPTITYQYPGTLHNVNSPFEYSFQGLVANSPYLPETGPGNRGFILTGYKASNGLSRCVIDELPGRPLISLPQLQNWDARYENPVPPYSFNLVGNSDATPLIPSNAVYNGAESSTKRAENLQHDDSYCLNHVLFDDWFFSSIASTPTNFGKPSSGSNPRTVYADFLEKGGNTLTNRAYQAIPEDLVDAAKNGPNSVSTKNVGTTNTAWKTIASRLEVTGMFNVNSTSVTAWRSLLGHARNQQVPYMDNSGSPKLSGETDHAISRFSVAGDVATSESGSSGDLEGAAEYTGYRVFDDDSLDLLAQEIVNQVRLRGPFLSLSEFVNRQLSSGDLALAGAIQTALNKLAAGPSNPYKTLQTDLTPDAAGTNIATSNPPGSTGYKFPAAAAGYNLYGIPGWTRQADVLRAIAPVLSVRDDTFTIRAYGDARDPSGRAILASAVCEATVRRVRDFVDPVDDAVTATLSGPSGSIPPLTATNDRFGRRFQIISFRWLNPGEI